MKNKHPSMTPHQLRKLAKKKAKRKEEAKKLKRIKNQQQRNLIYQLYRTILHFFPDLFELLGKVEDCREHSKYSITEIIMAGIALFLFKKGSRNALNNLRGEKLFKNNYRRLFKLRLPHLDTVDNVMRALPEQVLEELKLKLVKILLEKKVWHKQRLFGKYFVVAVDATGVVSFDHKHCGQCLHKTSKNGVITYFHQVLEAKLVTPSGFCVSLGTIWIENPEGDYDKQDCERKAFVRLAATLKKEYPRLPICITADSLYPSESFSATCKSCGWAYIVTFKDGTIPSIAKEAESLDKISQNRLTNLIVNGKNRTVQNYRWVNDIDYKGYSINWLVCLEAKQHDDEKGVKELEATRFVHLTDLPVSAGNVAMLSRSGRLRWKIENEGFNEQKNLGFNMSHKYSRVSYLAMKNYYQCLQVAHLFTQLMILDRCFQALLTGKMTCKHLWDWIVGFMTFVKVCTKKLLEYGSQKIQIRFVT